MLSLSSLIGFALLVNGSHGTRTSPSSVENAPIPSLGPRVCSCLSAPPDDADLLYKEVPSGHWIYAAVERLQRLFIIKGYPAGYFSGKRILTRFDFAVAIYRAVTGLQEPTAPPKERAPGEGYVDGDAPRGPIPPAAEMKLLRKLHLEFKAQMVSLGEDWQRNDAGLRKLQEEMLQRELAQALAEAAPKPEDARMGIGSQSVKRSDWAYEALKQVRSSKDVPAVPAGKILTRDEFASIAFSAMPLFFAAQHWAEDGSMGPPPPPYSLSEATALHKLVRAFRYELIQKNMDLKAIEYRLAEAEENLISDEECIDTDPPQEPSVKHVVESDQK